MPKIGLWQIADEKPKRLIVAGDFLERNLEEWIACDSSLLQSGLLIICRQMQLSSGRLDLLAIDPQGRIIVIEIKQGQLRREVLGQALDYASTISSLSSESIKAYAMQYMGAKYQELVKL